MVSGLGSQFKAYFHLISWDYSEDYSDGFWVTTGESRSRTSPTWSQHTIDGSFNGASFVYAVDINGDGDLDVLATANTADDITWWENDGSESFTEHTIDGTFDGARSAYAIDLDDDGDMDVLGAADQADDITWWENLGDTDGDGTINWDEHTIDGDFLSAYSVYAADIDGDGDVDVLGAANGNNVAYDISWWKNDGSQNFGDKLTIDSTFAKARCVYAQDVDLDGDMDVVGAAYGDGDINWWENANGVGTSWTEHAIDTSFGGASSTYAIDMDDDGNIDVLGAARSDDDITWWENSGTGGFTEHTIDGSFDHAISVYAIDMDNDGDVDVLGAARRDNGVKWWENDGSESFTGHAIANSFDGVESIHAADIDGDGDIDVLGAANLDSDIVWWENTATFSFDPTWSASDIDTNADGAFSVFAADMDNDGDMDIVSASADDSTIAWYENLGDTDGDGDLDWTAADIDTDGFCIRGG